MNKIAQLVISGWVVYGWAFAFVMIVALYLYIRIDTGELDISFITNLFS